MRLETEVDNQSHDWAAIISSIQINEQVPSSVLGDSNPLLLDALATEAFTFHYRGRLYRDLLCASKARAHWKRKTKKRLKMINPISI
ncbi:hypothetical protein M0R45_011950 [Rubus argutus]|uniref:Uncharacterized protein n=1 Tax=Rubus argutus TaxID=59490 RepID=A0AAW1YED3_RUBAR